MGWPRVFSRGPERFLGDMLGKFKIVALWAHAFSCNELRGTQGLTKGCYTRAPSSDAFIKKIREEVSQTYRIGWLILATPVSKIKILNVFTYFLNVASSNSNAVAPSDPSTPLREEDVTNVCKPRTCGLLRMWSFNFRNLLWWLGAGCGEYGECFGNSETPQPL